MQYLSLEEMQQVQKTLLREFDALCKQEGVSYDLCGGTMLGAVRHHGFIPWDDDIDVSMPRPDYERLMARYLAGALDMPKERSIVSCRDKTFPRHYARYVRHDVRRASEYASEDDCPFIGVDIFPIDGVFANERKFGRQVDRIAFLRRLLLLSTSKPGTSSRGALGAILKDIARPALRLVGPYTLARLLEKECMRVPFDSASHVGIITGMYGRRERMPRSEVLTQDAYEFEGDYYPGYKDYDLYLSNLYGNYMELPPEDQRVPHGDKGYWVTPPQEMG